VTRAHRFSVGPQVMRQGGRRPLMITVGLRSTTESVRSPTMAVSAKPTTTGLAEGLGGAHMTAKYRRAPPI